MFHRHRLLFRTLPILLALCALPALLLAPARSEGDPVFVGAGDIADCGGSGDEATAALLDSIDGTVFTLGDNAYPDGSTKDFADCYDPSWGRHKARTRPAVGNHEYQTPGGAGYYNYFGAAAGDPAKGYYAYDLGAWRIIVLNGEIDHSAGSTQEQWLRAELTAHANLCTLAIWHEPRFTSGAHGNDASFNAFWQALYQFGADVVLNGHDHHYERFAPQNPSGAADSTYGIREFIVGTGGKSLFAAIFPQPNSQVRNASTYGVLKLTLHAGSYDWEFVPAAGGTFTDSGSSVCHAAPTPPPPTPTPTLTPTPSPHNDILYLSSTLGGSTGGVTFADEDILAYNTASGAWSMVFDGSDVGTKTDLDAFELQSDGSILMSFAASSTNVPGLGAVDDSDIVRFIPTSLGSNTAGTFEWYFDGSDVGLETNGEDIDALGFTADGRLIVSTTGSFSVPGVSGKDEDLIAFTPTQLGETTGGVWEMYLDGSDVGLADASTEDIDAVWIDPVSSQIYLSAVGAFGVTGASGDGADVFICAPGLLGSTSICTFGPGVYWDGSANGFAGQVIDGFDLVRQ